MAHHPVEEIARDYATLPGGWDARFAVVRAFVSDDDIAAALIDPNGDGGSIDLDEYHRGPDSGWIVGSTRGGVY